MQILIVDDDEYFARAAGMMLCAADETILVDYATSGQQGVASIRDRRYDCVLLDYRLPDIDGLDVLGAIGTPEMGFGPRPAVVMMTGNGDETVAVDAMKGGACDYIVKGTTTPDGLLKTVQSAMTEHARLQAASQAFEQLQNLALTDPVTQLGNRHKFDMRLDQAVRRAGRTGESLCLIMLDLDGFKQVNDEHGHPVGDLLLVEIGRRIAGVVRDSDCAVRFGGDEFAILMESGATPAGAATLSSRIRALIGAPVEIDGISLTIGASIGCAMFPEDGDSVETFVRAADTAMYRDKTRKIPTDTQPTALTG